MTRGSEDTGQPENGERITWRAAPRLRRLAWVAVTAILAAVLARQPGLLLLGAPALAALAVAGRARPSALPAHAEVSPSRCFEGEEVVITATLPWPAEEVEFRLQPEATMALATGTAIQSALVWAAPAAIGAAGPGDGTTASARWVLIPHAWGRRFPGALTARCRAGGIWQADVPVHPGPVDIFPHPPPARASLVPAELLLRIGDHAATTAGAGIEFAGIRGYLPGDRLRDLNWAVTSRSGRWHVNQRAALRATDLIIMIDAFSEAGPHGDTSLDVAVRGAAGLATAYLRTGDRVGVVALGGILRWLRPAPGTKQFFRIVEMTFGMRFPSEVNPDLTRVPRTALPPRSLVVLFTPLLDSRAIGAITDLRQRGVSLVVVDVLRHEPPAQRGSQASELAVRLWRLDRRALRASLGVQVLDWDSGTGLDAALAPLRGRRVPVMLP